MRVAHGPLGWCVPEKPWRGPVERRDPDLVRQRSVHLTWLCRGCRSFTMYGSYLTGRCCFCDTPRPTED